MADDTMRDRLDQVERKPLKYGDVGNPDVRKNVSSDRCDEGALVALALNRAGLTRGQAAGLMGISEALLSRQIENVDHQHLSWQRLSRLPDEFWVELLVLVARRRRLFQVQLTLTKVAA